MYIYSNIYGYVHAAWWFIVWAIGNNNLLRWFRQQTQLSTFSSICWIYICTCGFGISCLGHWEQHFVKVVSASNATGDNTLLTWLRQQTQLSIFSSICSTYIYTCIHKYVYAAFLLGLQRTSHWNALCVCFESSLRYAYPSPGGFNRRDRDLRATRTVAISGAGFWTAWPCSGLWWAELFSAV